MLFSLHKFFEDASKGLSISAGGIRRIFTLDGKEIMTLNDLNDPEYFHGGLNETRQVVVSGGENFKSREEPEKAPFYARPQPRKWKPYTVGAMQHPTPSDKKLLDILPGLQSPKMWGMPKDHKTPNDKCAKRPRCFVFRNDGGHSLECVATLVYNFPSILEDAQRELNLTHAARRVFAMNGKEIESVDALEYDMKVVISMGEDFRPRKPDPFVKPKGVAKE